jgi:hypothetical protein
VLKKTIRRLARGIYEYPKTHGSLGLLSPTPEAVAKALAARDATRLGPSGAYAANLLGLSDHVPARIVFLTDGPPRRLRIGRQHIELKSTTPRNMATAGKASGTVIQALRFLGKDHIAQHHIEHLRDRLTPDQKAELTRDRVHAPGWMQSILDAVVRDAHA